MRNHRKWPLAQLSAQKERHKSSHGWLRPGRTERVAICRMCQPFASRVVCFEVEPGEIHPPKMELGIACEAVPCGLPGTWMHHWTARARACGKQPPNGPAETADKREKRFVKFGLSQEASDAQAAHNFKLPHDF